MNAYRDVFINIKKLPYYFWVVIFATFINQVGNMAFVFLMLYVTNYLGLTLSQGAIAFATVSISMFCSGVFAGNLIDRLGALPMMVGAIFLNCLVLLCFPLTRDFPILLLLCVAWGFFYGIYRPASQTFVSQVSATKLHKITFSIHRLAINLGMSIGPIIGGYLAMHSFPGIFLANGLANLAAGLLLVFGLRGFQWRKPNVVHKQNIFSLKWIKADSKLRWFLLAMVPISMIFFQHESTLPVYLSNDLHLPISFYGWLFTINTLMIVFLELALNVAMFNWPYRINFMLGTLLITVGFAGLYFASSRFDVVFLTVLWTFGEMILYPTATSYVAEIAPDENKGSYLALFNSASNLGIMIGPWFGALVMQHFGSSDLWLMCALWGLISLFLFNFSFRKKSQY